MNCPELSSTVLQTHGATLQFNDWMFPLLDFQGDWKPRDKLKNCCLGMLEMRIISMRYIILQNSTNDAIQIGWV